MNAAHTPGPWHLSTPYRIAAQPVHLGMHGAMQEPVAEVEGMGPLAEANARLIAAAPDLLAALRQLLVEVDEMTARVGWAGNGGRDLARAALEKAGVAP